jgi:hypothetical protein
MISLVLCIIIIYLIIYSSIKVKYLTPRRSKVDLLFVDPSFIIEQNLRQTALNQLTEARLILQSIELSITNMQNTLSYNTSVRNSLQSQYDNLIIFLSDS